MKAEKLYTKSVNYYSFVYYDSASKKRVRITRSYIQDRFGHDITDLEEAESVIQTLSHEIASRENDQKDRLAWASEAPEFMEMLELFLKTHKKNAPNSYGNTMHYLRYYVCHYFLQIACTPDVEQWGLYFDEFREWLEERATITRTPGQRISYNSKNHCIHALNIFLKFLYRKHLISHMVPCTRFPAYQMRMRTVDDLVSTEEMEAIYGHLKSTGHSQDAVFFRLLFFSGMRYSEAKGISLQNIYEGQLEDVTFAKRLAEHQMPYFGYLVLENQPVNNRHLRNDAGHVQRKPLKGKHRIDEKSARTIPIIDEVLWRDLAVLYNQELLAFDRKIWGTNPENYVLFEDTERDIVKKAYQELGLPFHSPHCCRHTRATWLIGETGDTILTRMWLGHTSTRVLERYVHVYQACVRNAKKGARSDWKPIALPTE